MNKGINKSNNSTFRDKMTKMMEVINVEGFNYKMI